jgi:hypothetical protein
LYTVHRPVERGVFPGMNVTDSSRASSGALLVMGALAANVGLTLLAFAVNWLVPGSYDGPFYLVQEMLWLAASGVLVVGLFQLSSAVDEPLPAQLAAGAFVVDAAVDLVQTLLLPKFGSGLLPQLVSDGSMLLSLAARGLLVFFIVRVTVKTHAWVLPLLATVMLLSLMRSAFSVAVMHQLASRELYSSAGFRFGMPLVSMFNAVSLFVGGLTVKAALSGAPQTPALVAAAGLQPAPATPISPAADFLVGGILLAVGIGVTVVSLAAASNGGRYVVATGAIAVGVGRIIRGFIRLAKR